MNITQFNKLKYYDKSFSVLYNELDSVPFKYRHNLMQIVKDIFVELDTMFHNEYVYDLGKNDQKLYIKKFWGTDGGLIVDLGLSADDTYQSCSLYLDEMRIW